MLSFSKLQRMAINSDAPNDELGWCRQSLMNYRPDIVLSSDPQWRYCQIVRTDVPYQNPVWYKKKRSYDQILSGGGKCGPRACKSYRHHLALLRKLSLLVCLTFPLYAYVEYNRVR